MIGISCGRAFANSLAAVANAPGVDGEMPDLADLPVRGEAPRTGETKFGQDQVWPRTQVWPDQVCQMLTETF